MLNGTAGSVLKAVDKKLLNSCAASRSIRPPEFGTPIHAWGCNAAAGAIALKVDTYALGGDFDAKITLYNAQGSVLASANPANPVTSPGQVTGVVLGGSLAFAASKQSMAAFKTPDPLSGAGTFTFTVSLVSLPGSRYDSANNAVSKGSISTPWAETNSCGMLSACRW